MWRKKSSEVPFEHALTRTARTLRARLVAGVLIVLAIVTALGLVWRQYEVAKDDAVSDLQARAILAATVFDTYFAGQLTALTAIAASPAVTSGETGAMTDYFARFRGKGSTFTAGVGWIDLDGRQRATSDPSGPISINLADRTYFKNVVATKKPFVSEAIVAQTTKRRLIVMSVPTRDERGRLTGVLAGGIVLMQSTNDARANELGYTGLEVIDREGQLISRRDLPKPSNSELVARLKKSKEGAIVDTQGLDGSDGRVVAYASSAAPGWTTVLDQPASTVFADARRSLLLEALLVLGASVMVLGLIAWAIRRARRDELANRARVSRWAELTRALNEAADSDEIGEIFAAALAGEFPEASVVVVLDAPGEGEEPQPVVAHGQRSYLTSIGKEVVTLVAEILAGTEGHLALASQSELQARGSFRAGSAQRIRSLHAVSLPAPRHSLGAVGLLFAVERSLGSHELAVVQAHADQVAQALLRVRRHEQEHDAAVLLQQSLLPDELPEADGVAVGAYYRAGLENTEVGGDWYDVVRRPDGIMHLTVGDVAGRGIDAAVSMGQLRHAFRAYAFDHVSPAAVVRRVGRHVERDGMATMVCATYDPYTRELACASAGHVPPLLVDPATGTVARVECSNSGPLGWLSSDVLDVGQAEVPPGTTLALYTDGFVERRGARLDEGIDRLGAAILEALPAEPRDVIDTVVRRLVESGVDDDLALLLVRIQEVPSRLSIDLSAEPRLLRELRRRVRKWLAYRGLEESAGEAAVLGLSEACNNAIEHGYRSRSGLIRVRLDHSDETLEIRVADEGSWREPVENSTRGRGILIMRGLMDKAEIVQKPNGTEVVLEQRL